MQITFGSSDPDETPEEKKERKQLEEERERAQNSPLSWLLWAGSLSLAW